MSIVGTLETAGLISPPRWMSANVAYETMMGSTAYGTATDSSDVDVYGFGFAPKNYTFPHLTGAIHGFGTAPPSFDQFSQHHIQYNDNEYDVTIYNIIKFFQLALENNPNIIDALFAPIDCVLHCTSVGQIVRDNRKTFLHKGCWHKLRGYSFSQLHKMTLKPVGKRIEIFEKHGFDCYLESETEFLTNSGWKKYDEIDISIDLIAQVDKDTGILSYVKANGRTDEKYTGTIYTIDAYLTSCAVTENHKMLVSQAHRSKESGTTKYDPKKSDWKLIPIKDLRSGIMIRGVKRSGYHIRRSSEVNDTDIEIDDSYLVLSGLFLSEGSTSYRNRKIRGCRFTQTKKGKQEFFDAADKFVDNKTIRRYDYEKETIYTVSRGIAEKLNSDFGTGSKNLSLPSWTQNLSRRQSKLLWDSCVLGDGTRAKNGDVLYTSSKKLADGLQAMWTSCGVPCSVRGPYKYEVIDSKYGDPCDMYQVYLPDSKDPCRFINMRSKAIDCDGCDPRKTKPFKKGGHNIKTRDVVDSRVVCFDVPSGVLVTRRNGRVAIHGNSKFGMHCVRLVLEAEQILLTGDLDLRRDREMLKSIRRGEWTAEQIKLWFADKEKQLSQVYIDSTIPHRPDEEKIKTILMQCLEQHYGNLSSVIPQESRYVAALREIQASLNKTGI